MRDMDATSIGSERYIEGLVKSGGRNSFIDRVGREQFVYALRFRRVIWFRFFIRTRDARSKSFQDSNCSAFSACPYPLLRSSWISFTLLDSILYTLSQVSTLDSRK